MLRLFLVLAGTITLLAVVAAVAHSARPAWVATDLGALGGRSSVATGINERGEIIGTSRTATGTTHGFVWAKGRMTDLGTLPGWADSAPVGINDHGQVVGWSSNETGGTWIGSKARAFLWQNGRMTDLGTVRGYRYAWPSAVNDRGQVVGQSAGAHDHKSLLRAFLWQRGTMTDLGTCIWHGEVSAAAAINARGEVAGYCSVKGRHNHAFLWRNGKLSDLGTLGGLASAASAINDRGQIVGWSRTAARQGHVFLWEKGRMSDLTPNGIGDDDPIAINAQGQVLTRQGFLWSRGTLMQLGHHPFGPSAMNDRGQAVGCVPGPHDRWLPTLWDNGRTITLTAPATGDSCAVTLNERNQIVGWRGSFTGRRHAVLWTLGTNPRE